MGKHIDGILGEDIGQIGDKIIKRKGKNKIVVQKGKKKNKHTKARQRTESLFEDLPKVWSGMKRWEKKSWENLLKSGHTFKNAKFKNIEDAMALFMSLNRNLQEAEEPLLRIAPSEPIFPQTLLRIKFDITVDGDGGDIKMELGEEIRNDTKIILYATFVLKSVSDNIDRREYRKIGVMGAGHEKVSSITKIYLKVFKKMPEEMDEISFKYKSVHRNLGTTNLPLSQIVMARTIQKPT
jgi:hypothetical protein